MHHRRRQASTARPVTRRRRPVLRFCVVCLREIGLMGARVASLAAALALGLLLLLDGRELVLENIDPRLKDWAAEKLGAEVVTVGSIEFSLGDGEQPAGLTLNDVQIDGMDNSPGMSVPKIETGFQVLGSLSGQVQPTRLRVDGVDVALGRGIDGALNLSAGGERAQTLGLLGSGTATPGFSALLQASNLLQEMDVLAQLERVDIGDLSLMFQDARSGRVLRAEGASAYVSRNPMGTSAGFTAAFAVPGAAPVSIQATLQEVAAQGGARYSVRFADARPSDLATQVAALSWLRLIEAPIDGALAAEVNGAGEMTRLSGVLKIGAGELRPALGKPVSFAGATLYFDYDPKADQFTISTLEVDTGNGRLRSTGEILLEREAGAISALIAQLDLTSITLAADSLLAGSVSFPTGEALLRVSLQPFQVEVGALELRDGPARVGLTGAVAAQEGLWAVALDAGLEELQLDEVKALWPEAFRPGLRRWLTKRLTAGRITEFEAHFRQGAQGRKGGLTFAFEAAEGWVLKDMPPMVGVSGRGQIVDGRFDLTFSAGRTAGSGPGRGVDLAGSRLEIADARQKPATMAVHLAGTGPVRRFLEIIDQPPLGLLARIGRGPELASGQAEVAAELEFPLRPGLKPKDVAADVKATLIRVNASDLVPQREVTADRLTLTASNAGMAISGDVRVGNVPMQATYRRDFTPGSGPGAVEGLLPVSPETLADLGIPIPRGWLSGRGQGQFALTLRPEAPPLYNVDVDLAGAEVSLPPLRWRKGAAQSGQLTAAGALGARPTVERISMRGPGLELAGRLDIGAGGITGANFERLRLGRWLNAPVQWRPRQGGRSEVTIRGGRIDLRGGVPAQASGGGGLDLILRPSEILVADKIRLTGVDGRISSNARPMGRFTANLNGAVPISGFLRRGGEVFFQSDNGGAALRAAGVFRNAFGGTLRVSLSTGDGPLNGVFSLKNASVVSDSGLADLLVRADAKGLARKVEANGITIDDAQGRFSIRGNELRLRSARAVGPSMGITLAGVYGLKTGVLDMEGVVSPLYAVNGIFQRLPLIGRALGGRPGEGLLGANFRITGTAAAPKFAVNPLSLLAPGAAREMFQSRAAN